MDRSWLKADRRTKKIQLGVEELLMFVFENQFNEDKIMHPCLNCAHSKSWKARTVRDHLLVNCIDETYTYWIWHGESNTIESPIIAETDTSELVDQVPTGMRHASVDDDEISLDSSDFINHVQGEHEPLYPGCMSYTKLKALVKLYNLKAKHGISDTCFSEVLLLIGSTLREGNTIPSSFGEAKKTLCALGMEYEKIHVCLNDYLLYHGERAEDETTCLICKASRWKLNKKGDELEGVPAMVLWYFPLIPRLRNLFNTPQIAKDMNWHDTE